MIFFKLFLSLFLISTTSLGEEKVLNLNELSKIATLETKHTLLFFDMNYCPNCNKMKKFVLKNKSIQRLVNTSFLFEDINIDDDNILIYKKFKDTKREFANKLNIDFYPTVIFLDEENKMVYRLKGYHSKDKFKKVLMYVREKRYIDINFSEYLDILESEN